MASTRHSEPDPLLSLWGENLRIRRKLMGLTQTDLAERMAPPVAQSTVVRWERGVMEPRRHYKAQLAHHLRASEQMLFPSPRIEVAS